ncbi:MAG: Zn-ribbon domain-containing OB-fold protein [Candidatus Hodarchaeales archaeon]
MTTLSIPSSWRTISGRYRLLGTRCSKEDIKYFPPRFVCPSCGGPCEDGIKFSGKGKLVDFTIIHVPPLHQQLLTPYIMGLVQLEEGPIVTTQIVGVGMEGVNELKEGRPMIATFRKYGAETSDAVIVYGYKFTPADLYNS